MNSLSFGLSVKLLISPLYLNEILAGYNNLGCRLLSFISLSMSCHSLLARRVSIERSALSLWGSPCGLFVAFPLLLLIYKGIPIRITADLSLETLQARREWQDILKLMKEKNLPPNYYTQQGSHSDMKEKSKALHTSKS